MTKMGVGAEHHATEGLCDLYLVLPNLRPLKPSLSAPLLDSKKSIQNQIETSRMVHTYSRKNSAFFLFIYWNREFWCPF